MSEFVTTIRRIRADKYSTYTQYDRVGRGREQAPVHQPVNLFFTVAAAYFTLAHIAPIA